MASTDAKGTGVVGIVNCILDQLQLCTPVYQIEDINPNLFLSIFEGLIGEQIIGARRPAFSKEDEELNCLLILEKLSNIVGVSLDHISPRALVSGDAVAVANLVEIFSGLMEQLMDAIFTDEEKSEGSTRDITRELFADPPKYTEAEVSSEASERADEIESRFPNLFSVLGRDRVVHVFDSSSPSVPQRSESGSEKFADDDLESLLNVNVENKSWKERSPLRNRNPHVNRTREDATIRQRKVAKLQSDCQRFSKQQEKRSPRRGIRFSSPPREGSTNSGTVLDSSGFKATFAELKSELENEKQELARRLRSVQSGYRRTEIALKADADEARFALESRSCAANLDTSLASSSEIPSRLFAERGIAFPKKPIANKKAQPSYSHVGFLSRTRAEEKKKEAVKRLCAKYKAENMSPLPSSPSPSAGTRRDLVARLQTHFPGLELDDAASRRLWAEYSRHVQALGRVAESARATTRRHAREAKLSMAEKQQQILLKIVRREMVQAKRIREENERRQEVITSRNRVEDAKIQRIRSQRYYSEFVEQTRARLANKQFGEEGLFRGLFRQAIKAQRERLLDLASTARELAAKRDAAEAKRAAILRTNFQNRLRLLNEKVSNERQVVETREKEQARYLNQMKREIRSRLESELHGVQSQMAADFAAERVAFRQLDAEAIKMQIYAEAKQTQPFLK